MEEKETRLPFLTRSSFWTPRRKLLGDNYSFDPFIFWLFEVCRPTLIVDVGASSDGLFLSFCDAADRHQLSASCLSIDTSESQSDQMAGIREYCHRNYRSIAQFRKDAASFSNPADGAIDILHVSANILEDSPSFIEQMSSRLSSQAVVLVSNINGVGLNGKWMLLLDQFSAFKFVHQRGLAVIGAGPNIPSPLPALLSLDNESDACSAIRMIYERLGGELRDALSSVDDMFQANEATIDHLVYTMHQERTEKVLSLERTHQATIAQLKSELSIVKQALAHLTQKYIDTSNQHKAEVKQLQSEVINKQNHIVEVESIHVHKTTLISDLHAEIKYLNRTVDSARKWLKKPFYKTLFSRWKPPQQAKS